MKDHVETARELLTHGAIADIPDKTGATPLLIAAEKNATRVAELLLAHGADPARRDDYGRTPMSAAGPGVASVIRRYLAKKSRASLRPAYN